MLWDRHWFLYRAQIPWPHDNWPEAVTLVESWLNHSVGSHYQVWAWDDSGSSQRIGVAFRWDQDRLLFVLAWQ